MRFSCNFCKTWTVLAATAMAAALPMTAAADQHETADAARWQQMREHTVSVKELLGADVHNVGTPVGSVRDLVLTEDGSAVQYVLYEIPYPYALKGASDGFAAFSNLAIERGAGFDTVLRFDDAAAPMAPERLTLDRRAADHRLVSRILGDTLVFEQQRTRPIEDILVDRDSGRITGYVVNQNEDAWFNQQPRIIAADQVEIRGTGNVVTSAELAALEPLVE